MENEIKRLSIAHRFFSSIPFIGTPLVILVEHTEMGIAQYGSFLGLLRGAMIGLILAVSLIVVSEVAVAAFDVGRFWIEVHVTSRAKVAIGQAASDQAARLR
jgi:hypothetical protein